MNPKKLLGFMFWFFVMSYWIRVFFNLCFWLWGWFRGYWRGRIWAYFNVELGCWTGHILVYNFGAGKNQTHQPQIHILSFTRPHCKIWKELEFRAWCGYIIKNWVQCTLLKIINPEPNYCCGRRSQASIT